MQIYGHRGAAGEAPENTIAGCLHAIECGVKYIEIDLRLSSDDQLIVLHDTTLRRTAGVKGKPSKYTARELAGMDARADGPPWPRKKDCGVPTLESLLKATGKLKGYQLEIKPDSKATIKRIAQHLTARFPTASAASKTVVTSSDVFLHKYLKEMAPHIRRGMVITYASEVPTLIELGCEYSAMNWSACDPDTIRTLRKAGKHISVWTVNDAAMVKKLHKVATDGLTPDLTFVFDVDLNTAFKRRGKNRDRLESESKAFFSRVRQGFLEIARKDRRRVKLIDASQPVDTVFKEVSKYISKKLSL